VLRRLEALLDVPGFIARPALRAALWHVIFVGAVTVIKSGTNALFLARADPQRLPLLYVAVAIVVALSTSALARLLTKSPPARVLTIGVIGCAVAIIASTVAAALGVPGATAVMYVVGEAAATSGSVLFWARVMDAFQARDQKKVVGVVGAGGMLGAALGGLGIRFTAEYTGVVVPMIVSAIAFVVALPLLRALRSRGERVTRDDAELLPALKYLGTRGYPIAVASLVVLLAATGAATDFVFRTASAEARSETEMAALFGMLNAVVGIVVVLFQLSLTSRLLSRLGVFAFVAFVPALLVGTSLLHVMLPWSFGILLAMKGIEMAGAYSLNQTAVSLLYNPMPGELRSQVRTLVDGAIKKGGAAFAGLVLGALAFLAPVLVGSWLVAIVAGATLLLLPILRARYLEALDDKLGQKRSRVSSRTAGAIDPSDKVTQSALRHALFAFDAERVLAALAALGPSYVLAPREITALVEHPEERVRTAALQHMPSEHDPKLVDKLLAIARADGPRRPRAEAVRALAKLEGARAPEVVAPFLDDAEPGVVAAALEVSLRGADGSEATRIGVPSLARSRLESILKDVETRSLAWRREISRLLGALGDTRYDGVLARLIGDEDETVRALAIGAAGRERHGAHLPLLIEHLGDRRVRFQAMQALAKFGDASVDALKGALDDQRLPVTVRMHIPRVLENIATESAARALLFSNPKDDAYLLHRIAASLVQIVARDPGVPVDKKRTDEAIGRRLVAYSAYDDARRDLESEDTPMLSLLRRAVRDRCSQNLKLALDLLGVHRGLVRMQSVYDGLASGREGARHDALELLDVALTGDPLREDFLALLERKDSGVRRSPDAARDRAHALCRSKDPLLRGIARRTVSLLGEEVTDPTGLTLKRRQLVVGPGAMELEGADMPENLVERLFLLEHVDLFEGLSTDDLSAIAAIATELGLAPGAFLYKEGESGTQLYVIIEGDVELTRVGRHIMKLRAGESAGQVSFLDRGPRPVTARVAEKPARFLVVEREHFMDLLADRPGLMHAFFGVLAARLRALIERDTHDPGGRRRIPTSV
jgi:HEAT repeat protein